GVDLDGRHDDVAPLAIDAVGAAGLDCARHAWNAGVARVLEAAVLAAVGRSEHVPGALPRDTADGVGRVDVATEADVDARQEAGLGGGVADGEVHGVAVRRAGLGRGVAADRVRHGLGIRDGHGAPLVGAPRVG